MQICLIDKNTGNTIRIFSDVIRWDNESVTYFNKGNIGKYYCDPTNEYLSDIILD